MIDRENLIELIDYWVECVDLTHWYSEELDESLADYLIENEDGFCSYGERREDETLQV